MRNLSQTLMLFFRYAVVYFDLRAQVKHHYSSGEHFPELKPLSKDEEDKLEVWICNNLLICAASIKAKDSHFACKVHKRTPPEGSTESSKHGDNAWKTSEEEFSQTWNFWLMTTKRLCIICLKFQKCKFSTTIIEVQLKASFEVARSSSCSHQLCPNTRNRSSCQWLQRSSWVSCGHFHPPLTQKWYPSSWCTPFSSKMC